MIFTRSLCRQNECLVQVYHPASDYTRITCQNRCCTPAGTAAGISEGTRIDFLKANSYNKKRRISICQKSENILYYLALSMDLTGWVRNEWDGTVTMEVQGRETLINKLLVGLNNDRFISIDWIDSEEIPLRQDEKKFSVK